MAAGQDIRITDVPFTSTPDPSAMVYINDKGKLRQTDLTTIAKNSDLRTMILDAHETAMSEIQAQFNQSMSTLHGTENELSEALNTLHSSLKEDLNTKHAVQMSEMQQLIDDGHDKLLQDASAVDDLRVNVQGIGSTTSNAILNTYEGGLKLNHMSGNTEQKQLSGKNRLQNQFGTGTYHVEESGMIFTVNDDKSVTVSGTSSTAGNFNFKEIVLPAGTYIVSDMSNVSGAGGDLVLRIYDHVNACTYADLPVGAKDGTFTLTQETQLAIYFNWNIVGITYSGTAYPMIRRADIADDTYEPYCGGVPSPNPAYPQAMMSTGDISLNQGYWDVNLVYDTKHVCTKNRLPCKAGDNVKVIYGSIASAIGLVFYDSNMNRLGIAHDSSGGVREFSAIAPTNTSYFCVNIRVSDVIDTTPQNVDKITLTINGKYLGCAKTHGGKNILGGLRFAETLVNSGADITEFNNEYVALSASANISKFVYRANFKENIRYTFFIKGYNSKTNYPTATNLAIYYTDGTNENMLFNSDRNIQNVQVSAEGKTIDYISGIWYGGISYIYYNDFGIMEGVRTLEDFVPYKETVAYYTTQYPMIKGSTLFRENGLVKVMHTRKEFVLDGITNTLGVKSSSTSNNGYVFYITDASEIASNNAVADLLCSHALVIPNNAAYGQSTACISQSTSGHYLWFGADSELTTKELANTWLQSNNVYVEYTLATPIIETLDPQSQIALNGLETFDGVTYVEFDTRVQPLEFEAEVGISQVGAYTLKCMNDNDTDKVEREELKAQLNELAVALVAARSEG